MTLREIADGIGTQIPETYTLARWRHPLGDRRKTAGVVLFTERYTVYCPIPASLWVEESAHLLVDGLRRARADYPDAAPDDWA